MKVVFVSFYSGQVERGAEVFVHELATRLGRKHDVTVIQSGPRAKRGSTYWTRVIPSEIDWTVKDARISVKRRLFIDYWSGLVGRFAWKALGEIGKADIVIPVDGNWESILVRLWAWKNRAKVVITGHSGMGWDDRVNLLVKPDIFVALSRYQAEWARRNSFGVRVVVIPNGVNLREFGRKVKGASVGVPRPVILCVGALEPNKRIDLVVEAVAGMRTGGLVVIGDGVARETIVGLGNKLLPGRFRHLARINRGQIARFFKMCDVFTLPTVPWEPFGLVYLEAMASGLPVVAPDDPIRREIVGSAGLFVDPRDTKAYSEALTVAGKKKWGGRQRKQAEKFSWEMVTRQYENLFYGLRRK